jgi:hypothetical protein
MKKAKLNEKPTEEIALLASMHSALVDLLIENGLRWTSVAEKDDISWLSLASSLKANIFSCYLLMIIFLN